MSKFISEVEKRRVFFLLTNILEKTKLKLQFYKMIILPGQEIALHRVRKIIKNSRPIKKKKDGKKIIINSVDGRHMPHTYNEIGIAKALQIRGHDVKVLICGGAFCKMCAGHFTVKKPPNDWSCKNCIKFSKRFYETTEVPYATYNDYFKKGDIEEIKNKVSKMKPKEISDFVYKGVPVGVHAQSSADRYFVGIPPDKEEHKQVLRCELINSMISTDVAERVVEIEKPDILVTSHGCYSSWGSVSDYFINKGIKTYVWLSGYIRNSVIFNKHMLSEYFKEYYEKIRKKKPLNEKEENELNKFLNKRIKGEEGDTIFYEFSKEDKNLKEMFNTEKYKKNYFLFPNVPWDRSIAFLGGKVAFEDVYKWVSHTIDLFKKKPENQLVIKIHPAEAATGRSEKTMLDYINEKYPKLPENIRTIPPDTDISAYSLFPIIDVGIVCNGTVGLEMSLNNIPVIITGNVHYSNKGFTYDVTSEEEYTQTIMTDITPLKDQQTLAKIYAYFFFIKSHIRRPYLYYKNFLNLGWKIKSIDDLAPGKDKYMDHFCDYIINDKVWQDW